MHFTAEMFSHNRNAVSLKSKTDYFFYNIVLCTGDLKLKACTCLLVTAFQKCVIENLPSPTACSVQSNDNYFKTL